MGVHEVLIVVGGIAASGLRAADCRRGFFVLGPRIDDRLLSRATEKGHLWLADGDPEAGKSSDFFQISSFPDECKLDVLGWVREDLSTCVVVGCAVSQSVLVFGVILERQPGLLPSPTTAVNGGHPWRAGWHISEAGESV